VVADAVTVEPVSASEFPANREIYREFCKIRPFNTISKTETRVNSDAYNKIPQAQEQGIISVNREIWRENMEYGTDIVSIDFRMI
jgi:hypothetical protein